MCCNKDAVCEASTCVNKPGLYIANKDVMCEASTCVNKPGLYIANKDVMCEASTCVNKPGLYIANKDVMCEASTCYTCSLVTWRRRMEKKLARKALQMKGVKKTKDGTAVSGAASTELFTLNPNIAYSPAVPEVYHEYEVIPN